MSAEFHHQERAAEWRKWRRWPPLFALGLGVAALSSIGLLLAPALAPALGVPADELNGLLRGWFGTITILLAALIMIHHLSFATAAVQLASTSIAREKRGLTWESLLLTGVDARQIVYGKWWATLRTLWQVYRPLLLLRFAVALWMGLAGGRTQMIPFLYTPALPDVLLIGFVTACFPLCYAAYMVTLGLLASLLTTNETSAYRLGSLFQLGALVVSLALILPSFALPLIDIDPGLVSLIPALFITPMDGGMLALIGLIANSRAETTYYLLGLLLCIALNGALTWVLLRGAQGLAIRQRALPPRR